MWCEERKKLSRRTMPAWTSLSNKWTSSYLSGGTRANKQQRKAGEDSTQLQGLYGRFLEQKGLLKEMILKGVRGMFDRCVAFATFYPTLISKAKVSLSPVGI